MRHSVDSGRPEAWSSRVVLHETMEVTVVVQFAYLAAIPCVPLVVACQLLLAPQVQRPVSVRRLC